MVLEADRARLRARGDGHRRGAVHPGPARAPGRAAARGRRAARPVRRRELRLPRAAQPVATTCASSSRTLSSSRSAGCAATSTCNYLRVREWQDLYGQLRQVGRRARASDARTPPAADPRRASTAPCSPAAVATSACATAADAASTWAPAAPGSSIFPGSALVEEAAALGDGRRAGGDHPAVGPDASPRIEPEWVEQLAAHLVKRSYSEPHWVAEARLRSMAYERVTLYGVPLVAGRAGRLRADRPGAGPRAVPAPRAGGGRLADPPPRSSRDNRAAARPRSRSWRTGLGAGTSWSTTRRCSPSTTRGSRPTWSPARHFDAWWKQAAPRAPRPARPSPATC